MELPTDVTEPKPKKEPKPLPPPVASLAMVDRAQLNASIHPRMKPTSFNNWLQGAIRDRGFPEPIRTGKRSCLWLLSDVQGWLASRPRKGVFAGRRKSVATPPPEAA